MRIALLLTLIAPAAALAKKTVTVSVPAGGGELRLTIDPEKLSVEQAKAAAALAPSANPDGVSIPGLELCVAGGEGYAECGDRTPSAPHFRENAKVNLDKGRAEVERIAALTTVPELAPYVDYLKTQARFYLGLEEARFEFYRTWKSAALARTIEGVDARAQCAPALAAIDAAKTPAEKFKRSQFDWHNCMNDAFRTKLGEYPKGPWKAFLKKYGVREKLIVEAD